MKDITTEEAIKILKHTFELHTLFFGDAGRGQLAFKRLLDELEKKNNQMEKHKKENINASKIIRKQNLMINAMAEYISNSDNDEIICKATKCEDEGCKNCIKQYFERKVKDE